MSSSTSAALPSGQHASRSRAAERRNRKRKAGQQEVSVAAVKKVEPGCHDVATLSAQSLDDNELMLGTGMALFCSFEHTGKVVINSSSDSCSSQLEALEWVLTSTKSDAKL